MDLNDELIMWSHECYFELKIHQNYSYINEWTWMMNWLCGHTNAIVNWKYTKTIHT